MSVIDPTLVRALLRNSDSPCISLYMPSVTAGPEVRQNAIRYGNLLSEVEGLLDDLEVEADRREQLMTPLWRLTDDRAFWNQQTPGLAVFRTDTVFQILPLPEPVEELATVESRFHLLPLLELLTGDRHFYVLALSLKSVRLFDASRHTIEEVPLPSDTPTSLRDALGWELTEPTLQHHSDARGPNSGISHGQGGGRDERKGEIRKFMRMVDPGVAAAIGDRQSPVVLAGVDFLLPMYREASALPNILERGVEGNPEHRPPEELRDEAWALLSEGRDEGLAAEIERFGTLEARGQASGELRDVVKAATDGRVKTLFVARDAHRWGHFDRERRAVEVHDERRPGDADLLDLAALETWADGGRVYVVEAGSLPVDGPAAATYRY